MAKGKNSKDGVQVAGAFLAGVAAAAVAGGYYLFGAKNAKQNRQKVEAWSVKAKGEVLEKIEKAKNITKEEYEKIVDKVSDKYSKAKDVGEKKAEGLRKELKRHWKDIKKEAEELENKGKKAVTKAKKAVSSKKTK